MNNNQIKYIMDFIKNQIGIKLSNNGNLEFIYSNKYVKNSKKRQLYIYNSEQDFSPYNKNKISVKHINLKKYNEIDEGKFVKRELPIFFSKDREIEFINKGELKIVKINSDIISSIFFILTRYEEFISDKNQLDIHDRFPAKESLACNNDFLERPIVDEYLELLRQSITWLGYKCEWKNPWVNNKFATLLTHDIDYVQKYRSLKNIIRPMAKNIIKYKSIKANYNVAKEYISSQKNYKKDPFWTFNYIIESENKYNFNSSFYFMTSNNKDKYDCNYDISSDKIQNLFRKIEKNNNEIGIHPNYFTFDNKNKFNEQVNILRNNISNKDFGGRQHFLRFDIKTTLDLYEKNNLLYDSTLSFADHAGFRCGTSHPFKVFSLSQNRELDLWEIPLIVMEGTLKSEKYMNLKIEEAINFNKKIIDRVKKYHGVFTFLWHNSSFTDDWDGWKKVYEETLNYIYEQNGKGMSGREIINILNS